MSKKFFGAVIPSIFAYILSGIYIIVDGFFIGNCVGDAGLAAINLAYPVTAFLQALGTGIGMGGAVRLSITSSQGDREASRRYFTLTLMLLGAAGLLCTLVLLPLTRPILLLLGAEGEELLGLSGQYMRFIVLGSLTQIFGTGITPLVRNLGSSVWAMTAMITGFVANILLDGLFIYLLDWGLAGAGLATVIGQGITALLCALRLVRSRELFTRRFSGRALLFGTGILMVGLSPFGLTFSPNFILIFMNRAAMSWGGADAVAQYAAISYLTYFVLMLLQGVGDGSQPLISWCSGQRDDSALRQVCRLAYGTAGVLTGASCLVLFLLRYDAPLFFGASPLVAGAAGDTLPVFFPGLLCLAFLRVLISRFYATGCNGRAYALIYGEPVFLALLLAVLPRLFGMWGVWSSAPLSQLLTAGLGALLALVDPEALFRLLWSLGKRSGLLTPFCRLCILAERQIRRMRYLFS